MTAARLEILRDDPLRPLNWRWRQAVQLHQHRARLTVQRADEDIRLAVEFLRRHDHCSPARQQAGVAENFDEFVALKCLANGDATTRAVIEAGILANEPSPLTGARVGSSAHLVDLYEALHFNVCDRLKSRGWVTLAAVGLTHRNDDPQTRRLKLLRRLAYRGGPVVLDLALSVLGPASMQSRSDGVIDRRLQLMELMEDPDLDLAVLAEIHDFAMQNESVSCTRQPVSNLTEMVPERVFDQQKSESQRVNTIPEPALPPGIIEAA